MHCGAAAEMRDALPGLGVEEARIGVNSGEVVTSGHGHGTLVTGDAVNVAARLEQAGSAGEVYLVRSATTRRCSARELRSRSKSSLGARA